MSFVSGPNFCYCFYGVGWLRTEGRHFGQGWSRGRRAFQVIRDPIQTKTSSSHHHNSTTHRSHRTLNLRLPRNRENSPPTIHTTHQANQRPTNRVEGKDYQDGFPFSYPRQQHGLPHRTPNSYFLPSDHCQFNACADPRGPVGTVTEVPTMVDTVNAPLGTLKASSGSEHSQVPTGDADTETGPDTMTAR